jgi:hypothetical protein
MLTLGNATAGLGRPTDDRTLTGEITLDDG